MIAFVLLGVALVQHVKQLRLERLAHAPEQMVRDAVDAFLPESRVAQAVAPVIAQSVVEQFDPFFRKKGADMHPVGNIAHGVFFRLDLRPVLAANVRRHPSMYARDAVVVPRAMQGKRSHVEIRAKCTMPQCMELLHRDAKPLAAFAEIALNHFAGKMIMASRYRRVGRENRVSRDCFQRAIEIQSMLFHQ